MDENSLRRCFFAIPISVEIQPTLDAIVHRLKKNFHHLAHIRWIFPQNRHITLRFLGNTTQQQLDNLSNEILTIIHSISSFDIEFNLPLFFPSDHKPRVLVLSAIANELLTSLALQLETLAQKNEFAAESRAFHAHMTLGRVKSMAHPPVSFPDLSDYLPLKMKVTKLILFQSIPAKVKVEYQALKVFSLN